MSVAVSAPQLTGTNGPSRPERRCAAAARTSFPVPVSPSKRIESPESATRAKLASSFA